MTKRTRRDRVGFPLPSKLKISTFAGWFPKGLKTGHLALDLSGLCEAPRTPTPPWTPLLPQQMMYAAPDCRRRHGHRGLAAEPGPREV
jgi:hypothetical protein